MSYTKEKQAAVEAVKQAARLCMAVRADMVGASYLEKGDKSPVTLADFGSQALVCKKLAEAYPNDVIVAEEDATDLRNAENRGPLGQITRYVQQLHPSASYTDVCDWIGSGRNRLAGRYWTLDPIDGTKGFLRNDQYAIALALVEDGEVKVGALACPALPVDIDQPDTGQGVLFIAVRGQGAEMTSLLNGHGVQLHVAPSSRDKSRRFLESVEPGHSDQQLQNEIARRVGITRPPLRMDSQAKYGVVARGDASLYLRLPSPRFPDYRENIWDHAAGSIIVEEAGGRVTDMFGKRLDFTASYKMRNNRGVVVSNGQLHEAVIEILGT